MSQFVSLRQTLWRTATVASLAIGLIVPLGAASVVEAQSSLPDTAAAAPEDTLLYHEISLDREGNQWQQVDELLGRVGVPNALDTFESELIASGSDSGDLTQADLDALFGGEMAIVVSPDAVQHLVAMMEHMQAMEGHQGKAMHDAMATPTAMGPDMMATPGAYDMGGSMGIAAVLEPSDLDTAWSYVERQFNAAADKEGVTVQSETYEGADLLVIEPAPNKGGKSKKHGHGSEDWMHSYPLDPRHGLVAARAGNFIIAGSSRDDVSNPIDVVNGNAPALADSASAAAVRAELPAELISFTYLSTPALLEGLGQDWVDAWEQAFGPEMNLEQSQGYAGIGISAEQFGFRLDSVMIPAEGSSFGDLVPENDPGLLDAASNASAGSFLFSSGSLPDNAFASAAYSIATAVNAANAGETMDQNPMAQPPTAEEINAQIEKAAGVLGFNPQTDLVDLLGRDFFIASALPTFSMDGFKWDFIAALGATDTAKLAATTQKIAALIERSSENVDVSTRQVDGSTVYAVGDSSSAGMPSIDFGVVGDHLVVGSGSGVDNYGQPAAASLADDAQFQAVMGSLPSEGYEVAYVNVGQLVDFFTSLRGGSTGGPTDNDPACAQYADQSAAQAALDGDPFANSQLDLDFDGQACEDAFAASGATPVAAPAGGLENLRAFGAVSYRKGETVGSSAILYIAEPGS